MTKEVGILIVRNKVVIGIREIRIERETASRVKRLR